MVKKLRLTKQQKTELDNNRYKQRVINQRVQKITENREEDHTFYISQLDVANQKISDELLERENLAKLEEIKRYEEKERRINKRFDNVDRGIDGVGDIVLSPFRSLDKLALDAQDGAFKVSENLTGMLTSPLVLIAVGGAAYILLSK